MQRFKHVMWPIILSLAAAALMVSTTAAQTGPPPSTPPAPVSTSEPPPDSGPPPGATGSPVQPGDPGTGPVVSTPVGDPGSDPIVIPEATAEVIDPGADDTLNIVADLLLPARLDLELLAGQILGATRPESWSGSSDASDPQLPLLIRFDLEILAGTALGADTRPEGWFGVITSTPYAIARDIRHDLELLADTVNIERPSTWMGGEPLLRCNRATQSLVRLLEQGGVFTLQADRTAPDFCQQAATEASVFVEVNFLANPDLTGRVMAAGLNAATISEPAVTEENAVGFLDLAATIRGGIIPVGERIEPVARDSGTDVTLMLVRGIGFEMFVDYRFTNIDEATFNNLPGAGTVRVAPRCDAGWCS
ncbi:MAG: hypothetical protein ACOCX3_03065 [Chloroflexota bacterium]